MSRKLLFLGLMLTSLLGFSQQEVQYTNFMFSNMAFNPGYAGINRSICLTALARQQWMGFASTYDGKGGSPQDIYFTGESNIDPLHGGIGLTVIKDKIGFEDNIAVRLAYSFHLNVGPGKLGIGIQGGFINKKVDFSKFKYVDQGDQLLQSSQVETSMNFDMAFGAYYKIEEKLYAGISTTQLTQSVAEFSSTLGSSEYKRHYFIHGGYYYELPMNPSIVINPNVLIKTDFAAAQYDFNALAWYNKTIYAGVSYRAIDAIAILAGYRFLQGAKGGAQAGIAYDITTSALGAKGSGDKRRSFGSAEVYVNYCFEIIIPVVYDRHKTVLFL